MATIILDKIVDFGETVDIGGHKFNLDTVKFYYGFEGAWINVCKKDDRLEFKSDVMSLEQVRKFYWDIGGPVDISGSVDFFMVHPDLLVASRMNVGAGFLVANNLDVGNMSSDYNVVIKNRGMLYANLEIGLEQANAFLAQGFYSKEMMNTSRLNPGEFIWIDTPMGIYRIVSTAYYYRYQMLGGGRANFKRFYELVDHAYIPYKSIGKANTMNNYREIFDIVFPPSKTRLYRWISRSPVIGWKQEGLPNDYLKDRASRIYNIWLVYLLIVPMHRQIKVVKYLDRFYQDRMGLCKWLKHLQNHSYKLDKNISAWIQILKRGDVEKFIFHQPTSKQYHLVKSMYKWYQDQNFNPTHPVEIF